MQTPTRRAAGVIMMLIGGVTTVVSLTASPAGAAVGPEVTPVFLPGASNQNCGDLDDANGGGQTWLEVDTAAANGTTGPITITNFDGASRTFDWSSTIGIDAVYVKGGSGGAHLYVYAPTAASPEAFGDDGLTTPGTQGDGISHMSFCYDTTDPSTTTTVEETTTTVEETTTTVEETTTTVEETTTTTVPETTTTTVPETTTTTVPETTTTTAGQSTTTTTAAGQSTTTTTAAGQSTTTTAAGQSTTTTAAVLGSTVTQAQPQTQVAGAQLARTGLGNGGLLAFSVGLLMVGTGTLLFGEDRRLVVRRR